MKVKTRVSVRYAMRNEFGLVWIVFHADAVVEVVAVVALVALG